MVPVEKKNNKTRANFRFIYLLQARTKTENQITIYMHENGFVRCGAATVAFAIIITISRCRRVVLCHVCSQILIASLSYRICLAHFAHIHTLLPYNISAPSRPTSCHYGAPFLGLWLRVRRKDCSHCWHSALQMTIKKTTSRPTNNADDSRKWKEWEQELNCWAHYLPSNELVLQFSFKNKTHFEMLISMLM